MTKLRDIEKRLKEAREASQSAYWSPHSAVRLAAHSAYSTERSAAWSARLAAYSASRSASYLASRSASYLASWSVLERKKQVLIIKEVLNE